MPGHELIGREELDAISEIFTKSGGVLMGHAFDARRNNIFRLRLFEEALCHRLHAGHAQVVSSGTAALFSALRALGVGPGDEVITQAFTFVASVEAIVETGATPIVVEVDETLNMSPAALQEAITSKTRCILPVHMLGNPARMDEILAIAAARKVPVLEDACEALGATYRGTHAGVLGDMGAFSLDFGKTITTGEGGFVLTNNADLYKFLSDYVDHGHEKNPALPRGRDSAVISGFNFRMSEMQAAVGLVQLSRLDDILERARANKARLKGALCQGLGPLVQFRTITDPGELADNLVLFLPDPSTAARAAADLAKAGVGTGMLPDAVEWHASYYWDRIWKHHSLYAGVSETAWPKTRALLERAIGFGISVLATNDDLDRRAETIVAILRKSLG